MNEQATQHLLGYDAMGKQLFLHTLRIMLCEMKKRYQHVSAALRVRTDGPSPCLVMLLSSFTIQVDPLLLLNLEEVEKIARGYVKQDELGPKTDQ